MAVPGEPELALMNSPNRITTLTDCKADGATQRSEGDDQSTDSSTIDEVSVKMR